MLTVLSVIGTRPEAIKMAPVVKELERYPDRFKSIVCITGQHREMLTPMLDIFNIHPNVDLGVMIPGQTLSQLTARLMESLEKAIDRVEPDWVLAQGDTTTVLSASLVSFHCSVRFGHVEAGLRTGDIARPFPEEMNRRIADSLSTVAFAPTKRAGQALVREGHDPAKVHVTGNTVVDALMDVASRPFDWGTSQLSGLQDKRLVLVTAHRRESFGQPLREICESIRVLAERFSNDGLHFIYPVHLNRNVQSPVLQILSGLDNVSLLRPLDYLSMVHLMKRAELVLTDSGGIQEEAPTFGVPVLVLRDTTERPEGLEAGVTKLVGTSRENIINCASWLLEDPATRANWPRCRNPYGDGKAAERIVSVLLALSDSGRMEEGTTCTAMVSNQSAV